MDAREGLSRQTQRPDESRSPQQPSRAVVLGSAPGEQQKNVLRAPSGSEPRVPGGRRSRRPATRVLLVVNNVLYRCGLRALLENQPDLGIVGEAHDCREATECLRHLDASVVLMDTRGLGISPVAAIRALSSHALLVLASPGGELIEEAAALRAGACGLLRSTANPVELAAALRVVEAGYTLHLQPATERIAGEEKPHEIVPDEVPKEFLNLTHREQQVFRLMVSGFSNAEIAEMLALGESTIKSHVQHLLTKLGTPNRVHAVIYAYRHGLVTECGRFLVAGLGSDASAVA